MRIAVAVLTHNPTANGRMGLLRDCWASLGEADEMILVDNGSTDGTEFCDFDRVYRNPGRITTSGAGTNLQGRLLSGMDADICVMSDDDMIWSPGWAERLVAWWHDCPHNVVLTGCHLEPEYDWNQILKRGDGYLIRASTGAASWSFRHGYWPMIGPIPHRTQGWGDVPACNRLTAVGMGIAQIDLAEHRGVSTWGNQSSGFDAQQVRASL